MSEWVVPPVDAMDTEWGPLYPFILNGRVPEHFAKLAEKKLGETPQSQREALELLKEIIREMSKLNVLPTDDDILLIFLRATKYHAFKAYILLKNYYANKREYFDRKKADLETWDYELNMNYFGFLPYRDPLGRIVIIGKAALLKVDTEAFDRYVSMAFQFGSKLLEEPVTQISGMSCILDLASIDWKVFTMASMRNFSLAAEIMQNGFPVRYKGLHILNEPLMVKILFKAFGVFIGKKYKKKIYFHGRNYEELYEFYPPCMLPVEYGGMIEQYKNPYTAKEIQNPKLLAF